MAAIQDFLKQNVKFQYAGLGLPFAAMDIKGIIDSDNKFKALGKTFKDLLLAKASLVGTFTAVGIAIRALVKDTGSLDAALKRLSTVQHFQRLFAPFVGGAKEARRHVAELLNFASNTPFKFEGVAQAAHTLQTLTRGQFAGEPALKKIGDAAALSGNSIEESSRAVGEFYQALQNGEPVDRSVEALRQMGLISTVAADNLTRLSQSGGNAMEMASGLTNALNQSRGGMRSFAQDVESVALAREKAVEKAKISIGTPFTQQTIQSTQNYTEALVAITPAIESVAKVLATFFGGLQTVTSGFVKFIAKTGLGETAIKAITVAVVALAAGLTAMGAVILPKAIGAIAEFMVGLEAMAARMGAVGIALRVLGNVAATAAIATGIGALAIAVAAIGKAVYDLTVGAYQQFNKALREEAQAHRESINAINGHIAAITTLAEKQQVVAETIQKTTEAQNKLTDLLEKQSKLTGFSWMDKVKTFMAINPLTWAALLPQAGKRLLDYLGIRKQVAQAEQQLEDRRRQQRKAELTPATAGPERQALIQMQMRRQLMLEEQQMEERIAITPGARPEILRERAGVLGERATRGRRGIQERERIALLQDQARAQLRMADEEDKLNDLQNREQRARGVKGAHGKELAKQVAEQKMVIAQKESQISNIALQADQESSVALEQRAKQLSTAINARALRAAGMTREAARQEVIAGPAAVTAAGRPGAGAQLLELQARAARAKQFEEQAPELEIEQRRKTMEAQEEERGRFVTELQTHIERGMAVAARQGTPGQKELLTDLRSFIGHFEDLRRIFPDQKAAQLAMEKVGTDLMNMPAEIFKPIGDSLTRIGGGGGVGGPTGDPRTVALQRMANLQGTANSFLQQIEQNTREKTQAAPPSTELPPTEAPALEEAAPAVEAAAAAHEGGAIAGTTGAATIPTPTPVPEGIAGQPVPTALPAPTTIAPVATTAAVAPPAPPAYTVPVPAIPPPAAPAVAVAAPAIPPPATPARTPAAIAPPAAPIPTPASPQIKGMEFYYGKPVQPTTPTPKGTEPTKAAPTDLEKAKSENVTRVKAAKAERESHLGVTIGTKEHPLPKAVYPQPSVQPSTAARPGIIQPAVGIQGGVIQPAVGVQSSAGVQGGKIQSGVQPSGKQYGVIQPQPGISPTSEEKQTLAATYNYDVKNPNINWNTVAKMDVNRKATSEQAQRVIETQTEVQKTEAAGVGTASSVKLEPSFVQSIGKTIGTKETPLPSTPGMDQVRLLNDIYQQNRKANDHLTAVASHTKDAQSAY